MQKGRDLQGLVVPYIGTWIETTESHLESLWNMVVPYIGTWIETVSTILFKEGVIGRTLYRYVD